MFGETRLLTQTGGTLLPSAGLSWGREDQVLGKNRHQRHTKIGGHSRKSHYALQIIHFYFFFFRSLFFYTILHSTETKKWVTFMQQKM